MKRCMLDNEIYNALMDFCLKKGIRNYRGQPSVNEALKFLFVRGVLKLK